MSEIRKVRQVRFRWKEGEGKRCVDDDGDGWGKMNVNVNSLRDKERVMVMDGMVL